MVIREALRRGWPIPPPYNDPPVIEFGLGFYGQAFGELSAERQLVPNGLAPIHRREIREFLDRERIRDGDEREIMYGVIERVDAVWLALMRKKRRLNRHGDADESGEETKGIRGGRS